MPRSASEKPWSAAMSGTSELSAPRTSQFDTGWKESRICIAIEDIATEPEPEPEMEMEPKMERGSTLKLRLRRWAAPPDSRARESPSLSREGEGGPRPLTRGHGI